MNLDLTLEELNVVLAGLGKLPLETAINVFAKVREQAQTQLNNTAPDTPPEASPKVD